MKTPVAARCSAFLSGLALTLGVSAAAPAIDDRPALPNETGYHPAERETVHLNPPSLTWVHVPAAKSYTVELARQADFEHAITVQGVPWCCYTHSTTLAPGKYFWRYRVVTVEGQTSNWSPVRSFVIPPDATAFPMPTPAQQRVRLPKSHPRLFLRPEDLPRLRALSQAELSPGNAAEVFAHLRAAADRLRQAEPTPEPTVRASAGDDRTRAYWWPNRLQALKACQEAETLAWVFLMTGDSRYGQAARKWVLHLASWDPDGPTNFGLNDEAAFPLLYRLPRAYDWAYDALSPADRDQVRNVMRRRGLDAWKSSQLGFGVGHLNRPYSSHANRAWHKLAECAIAFYEDIPEAPVWLDFAVNNFYACYPVWSDDDGGWHEGLSYWTGYMMKAVWWLQSARSALDVDGFKKPFFAQVGDFPLYLAPPHSPNMGLGDLSYQTPAKSWGPFMGFFARITGNGHTRWFMDQWNMVPDNDVLAFLYAANLPPLPAPKPPTDLPPSKIFRGIGVASLHLNLTNSDDDVHFLFKSSPFGSQSHGHNPQNSFQLNAYGEALLPACVYRDWHGSPFHYQWCHSTRAQNAVLVNGEGQVMHKPGALGRLVDWHLSPELDYVVGDATPAYGGRLTRYHRHVAFVKPDLIVLFDDLEAPAPATFQFMLHALRPFTVDAPHDALSAQLAKAGVQVKYLSPVPLAFRQWDGYQPKPEKEFPNQWHVEAGTTERRQQLGMLTVIIPYRAAQAEAWTAERLESDTALGARVLRNGKAVLVAFRKPSVSGPGTLAGWGFEGAVGVKK